MDEPQNPPAVRLGESLSKVLADAGSNREVELCDRYAIYTKTISLQGGLVAAGAYYNRGVIHLFLGQYKEACWNFERALELDDNDKKASLYLDYAERKDPTISFKLEFHQNLAIYEAINKQPASGSKRVK